MTRQVQAEMSRPALISSPVREVPGWSWYASGGVCEGPANTVMVLERWGGVDVLCGIVCCGGVGRCDGVMVTLADGVECK